MPTTARTTAFMLGSFLLLSLLGALAAHRFDSTIWLFDLRPLGPTLGAVLGSTCALALIVFALRPRSPACRAAGFAAAAALSLIAAIDSLRAAALGLGGSIHLGFPIPLSLLVLAACTLVGWSALRGCTGRLRPLPALAAAGMFVAAVPIGQMTCFGATDYRRPADAALVFGARTYADGSPSKALEDRLIAACELYETGQVRAIIMSGGPGDGQTHEAEAMRDFALHRAIPPEAIILDRDGLSTAASVANARAICDARGYHSLLAVSHFYHLPRIKLAFDRPDSRVRVRTVPASMRGRPLAGLPYFMAREAAALWVYWARG